MSGRSSPVRMYSTWAATPSTSPSAPVTTTTRASGSWNSGRSAGRSSRPLTITVERVGVEALLLALAL